MKVALESEVLPLFLAGVLLVVLVELIFSMLVLRRRTAGRRMMVGHVICLLISCFCLGFLLFIPRPTSDGDVRNGSGLFALFGISWALSEIFVLSAVSAVMVRGKKEREEKREEQRPAAAEVSAVPAVSLEESEMK